MDDVVFAVERDLESRRVTYTLVVDAVALADVKLDELDRRFIRESDGPNSTISDKLLALQTLIYRMEQQRKPPTQRSAPDA